MASDGGADNIWAYIRLGVKKRSLIPLNQSITETKFYRLTQVEAEVPMILIEESCNLVTAKDPKTNRLFIDVIREYLVSENYQVYCPFHSNTETKSSMT